MKANESKIKAHYKKWKPTFLAQDLQDSLKSLKGQVSELKRWTEVSEVSEELKQINELISKQEDLVKILRSKLPALRK